MGLFKKKSDENETKCKTCGLELHDPERLKRHTKKAHGHLPAKKMDPQGSEGSLW
ncbi:hypothetical protein [Candidatus Nitrosotenuis cloacae]|jgi:uncharacterized C2H2 Zn-finger protein|uniref:hypothetical protein n=1 Tax=Candidatus Nitrosotenuis cloacae TaxID=1603555 RepID=UPI002281C818|nr:hypothetical protein [Candidatus Nitrosotenuis cloacae]